MFLETSRRNDFRANRTVREKSRAFLPFHSIHCASAVMRLLHGALCFAFLVLGSSGMRCYEWLTNDLETHAKISHPIREIECKSGEVCLTRAYGRGACQFKCAVPREYTNPNPLAKVKNTCEQLALGDFRCYCETGDLCNYSYEYLKSLGKGLSKFWAPATICAAKMFEAAAKPPAKTGPRCWFYDKPRGLRPHLEKKEIQCKSGEVCFARVYGRGGTLCQFGCAKPLVTNSCQQLPLKDLRCYCNTDFCTDSEEYLWGQQRIDTALMAIMKTSHRYLARAPIANKPTTVPPKPKQHPKPPTTTTMKTTPTTVPKQSSTPNSSETVTSTVTSSQQKTVIGPLLLTVPIVYFIN